MTDEELVGQLMRAIAELKTEVARGQTRTCERLQAMEERIELVTHASQEAFEQAMRVNNLVHHLTCMEEPTNPNLADCLSENPAPNRHTLHSVDESDELSSATLAAIGALKEVASEAVQKERNRSTRAAASKLSFGNFSIEGKAGLIALASVLAAIVTLLTTGHLAIH